MKTCLLLLAVLGLCLQQTHGFGYLSSKYRPDQGYGNWGSYGGYRSAFPQRISSPSREQLLEALLGAEAGADEEYDACAGQSCSANDHCCQGHICMAFSARAAGTCMEVSNQRAGDECASDAECEAGMACELGVCTDMPGDKLYGEDCTTSSECDHSRGLCCQIIRRHRQAPKKMCGYYKDPMGCMGRVPPIQSKKRGGRPAM